MLELYHSVNSVCAQKVRIALAEKGLEYKEHLMTLAGDQFDPAYMKLNPNAVVPTLIHDGHAIIEFIGDPLLSRRGVSRTAAHAGGAARPRAGSALQQAHRRVCPQFLHDFELRHRLPMRGCCA